MKKEFIIIIFFFLFVGIPFTGCLDNNNDNKLNNLSPLNGLKTANEVAEDWNKSAVLVQVISGEIDNNGNSPDWTYFYLNNYDIYNSTDAFDVNVNYKYEWKSHDRSPVIFQPIENWTLDFKDVLTKAKSDPEIKVFLNNYNANIKRAELRGKNDTSCWTIEWNYKEPLGDAFFATIQIDAGTGEINYVETSD